MIRKAVYLGGRELWRLMVYRPAQRGTWSAMFSSIGAAIIVGLISWWGYSHR